MSYCPNCGTPHEPNAGFCVNCGHSLTGQQQGDNRYQSSTVFPGSQGYQDTQNTSGLGTSSYVPQEIRCWNWGAFFLNWIWGIGNSVWIALLMFIPIFNWVWIFFLGAKGNEWAWQSRRWDSVEHFKRTQQTWTQCGVGLFVFYMVIIILSFIFSLAFGLMDY